MVLSWSFFLIGGTWIKFEFDSPAPYNDRLNDEILRQLNPGNYTMSADCLFCKIIAGDIPSNKVFEDEDLFAFRDINPAAPVHILLIPKRHLSAIDKAVTADELLLGKLLLRASIIARDEKLDEGFRLVINTGKHSGRTIFHLHLHILGGRAMGPLG
ncbi:MAG: histidine triad nucleotide-binding protein [Pseudohongiellaceae bacterium]